MGTERNDNIAISVQRPRGRFSDRLQFKRGHADGRAGRAPATMQPQYVAGYSEGRRQARAAQKCRIEATTESPEHSRRRPNL